MSGYLLDTNHLSHALDHRSTVRERIMKGRMQGLRIGTCTPVLCELAAGLVQTARHEQNWQLLQTLLRQVKVWPLDVSVARHYGDLYAELRKKGRILSQVDIMLAALARSEGLTILTTDRDFEALSDVRVENWAV